jgi:hypothetical protein
MRLVVMGQMARLPTGYWNSVYYFLDNFIWMERSLSTNQNSHEFPDRYDVLEERGTTVL